MPADRCPTCASVADELADPLATVRAALDDESDPTGALLHATDAIAALADECERLRGAGATEDLLLGRVAELTQVRDELTAKHDTRGRLLSDQDARIATLEAELAAARALEAERNQLRNTILHLSMALDVEAVKAESCAEGWRLLAVATLAEVRKLAAARAVPPDVEASQPATVGGLLATAPVGSIVEWKDGQWFRRCVVGRMVSSQWIDGTHRVWTGYAFLVDAEDLRHTARLVPAHLADADPASRGDLPQKGG